MVKPFPVRLVGDTVYNVKTVGVKYWFRGCYHFDSKDSIGIVWWMMN